MLYILFIICVLHSCDSGKVEELGLQGLKYSTIWPFINCLPRPVPGHGNSEVSHSVGGGVKGGKDRP